MSRCVTMMGVGLMLTAACSDGVGPGDGYLQGMFALHAVNGRDLPTTIAEGGGQRYVIVGDTLRFGADGTVARSMSVRHMSTTPEYPPDTTYHDVIDLPYVVESNRVIIGYRDPCPPNALCIGFEEGRLTLNSLRVVGRLFWPGEPILSYRRVP